LIRTIAYHKQLGFCTNWVGNQQGGDVKCHIPALGLAIVPIVNGVGAWSVDALIAR